jgi:hypothetical protein
MQNEAEIIFLAFVNLNSIKDGAKHELLFNRQTSRLGGRFVEQKLVFSSSFG